MNNPITTLFAVITFGLILNSAVMAGEEVDAFTLSFQNNSQEVIDREMSINKVSFIISSSDMTSNVLDLHYDSVE
jgi:hypothetical protein